MEVKYLVGLEATRLSRKCRKDRDRNYRSRTQYNRDVEEGKARIRALALMEEISYEISDDENSRDKIVDAVTKECKAFGYTIFCREAALRRTVEAASAITMGAMASRRKWMIDSGCAMDLVSRKELAPEEMELAERVRKIKLNTANGSTASETAINFDIETLSECALVRILDSTPAVLSMGMRCMRMGYSFHWTAGHDPIFVRPDNKHVKLRVIGDIPYLTEAMTTAVRGKGIEPFRTLPAMPAPTVMCSAYAKKLNMIAGTGENRDSSEDESDDGAPAEIRVRSRSRNCWMFDRGKLVLFIYEWRRGIPDPIVEAIKEPWTIEYLAGSRPVCKVRATLRDGKKLSIWRDWMKPLGYQDPSHTVDVQITALDDSEWKGKMVFKIPREEQARKLHGVIEKVRKVVDKFTRPDPQNYGNGKNRPEERYRGRRECPACAADSIGLCSIHERRVRDPR